MFPAYAHTPVLLASVLSLLAPRKGEAVLDVTLGLGGHASAFLEGIGTTGTFIGLDADASNLEEARRRLARYPNTAFHHGNFGELASLKFPAQDIVFADLGLSSPHVDDPERGFSFRSAGPLDLRFDRSRGLPASAWILAASLHDLMRALSEYGELKNVRKLAEELKAHPHETTSSVVRSAEKIYGWRAPSILPQVFQALRIAVNDELMQLDHLLTAGPALLKPGGRMGVISYHSLEDRRVKRVFRALAAPSRDERTGQDSAPAFFELLTRKALVPTAEEIAANPRARSAKFRVIRRMFSHS